MNEILMILESLHPEHDFVSSEDYIEEGLLDSFDIVTIVAELESKLAITIDGEDILPENFRNLETLDKFVRRYL